MKKSIAKKLVRRLSRSLFYLLACLVFSPAVFAGQSNSGLSSAADIQDEPAGSTDLQLRGVVVDENDNPIANAKFKLQDTDGRVSREELAQLRLLNPIASKDGSFELNDIPAGCQPTFQINDPQNKLVGYLHVDGADKVKLQDDLTKLRIRLVEGTVVQGKVLFEGKPIPNQAVHMRVYVGRSVSDDRLITYEFSAQFGSANTDENGEYRFENVFPESDISVYTNNSQGDRLDADAKSAKPGEKRFVKDINFQTLASQIEGIVVDSRGKPVKGAIITVMDPGGGQQYNKYRPPGERSNVSGADGRFKAKYLPQKKLWLWVHHPRESGDRKPSAQLEIVAGETGIKIVLDERLGQKVRKRK